MSIDRDLAYWLALWRQPYIGSARMQKLLALSSDLSVFFKEGKLRSDLSNYLDPRSLTIPLDWKGVEVDLAWVEAAHNHHIIKITSPLYSPRLKEIAQAPAVLFVKGDPTILSLPQIGMVGSRHPTPVGFEDAFHFAKSLSEQGMVVTSGLAMGIDAASHKGALQGGGLTIAVLGHGLDQIYPKCNESLANEIVHAGALVSEFPIGVEIKAQFFPKRNRLISGLSVGIFVVEAALQSGSLITANYALEQGREVFAMPGSIHNPLAKGCNSLIRQGAKCVETAQHLIEEIHSIIHVCSYEAKEKFVVNAQSRQTIVEHKKEQPSETNVLLEAIGYVCTPIDSLVERTGFTIEKLSNILLEMELEGIILAVPGGYLRQLNRGERQ